MCTVAISNSPVFSPSRVSSSIFCKSSQESRTLTSPTSSSSSFKLRLQKPLLSGLAPSPSSFSSSSSPTFLKRKRPTRLDIPVASLTFSGDLPTPSTVAAAAEDRWREVEFEGDGYSVYCKRGRREFMEDRFKAKVIDIPGQQKQGFFGVFDGHGGPKAAEFAAKNLDEKILEQIEKRGGDDIQEAIKEGYLSTDSEFLRQDQNGGSCCVTALIRDGNLVVSNAGDCRAVVSRGGVAEALTSDHRASRPDEQHRIESLGGYVDCCHGVWRVLGSLAVSRGIGDRSLKQWVMAEPETRILELLPELEFLILASDGLWDKVSNQEAVDIVRPLCVGVDKPEALAVCKSLAELSASRGSVDDTSVMLIQLNRFC